MQDWLPPSPSHFSRLQLLGDGLFAVACFGASFLLCCSARRHAHAQRRWVAVFLAIAAAAAGGASLIRIVNFWQQAYWFEAWADLAAGAMLVAGVAVSWPLLPGMIAQWGSDDLREAYRSLWRRQRQLADSENRYRLLAETAGEGVWVLDSKGVTTYANQALHELLRCESRLVGRKLTDFVFEEDVETAHSNLLRRLSGIRERHEFRFRRGDGQPVYTIVYASPVRDDSGTPIGTLKVITDISELVGAERKLEQLNRELEQRVEERTRALEASNRELAQEVVTREYIQQELRASNENLNRYLEELERQNEDITRLNLLSEQLHRCDTYAELRNVLERNCAALLKSRGGVLCEWNGEQLRPLDKPWGEGIDWDWTPPPHALLALRHGRLFPDSVEEQNLVPAAQLNGGYALMVALQSRGESIGALVLARAQPFWTGDTALDERFGPFVRALADHAALALSNLMLREQLREQSLSDPLTGLYNRRYMYEQLARLIALWERGGQAFAVILLDVDHFKSFNDRFGHDVGDEVLVAIADVLHSEVRKSDIACRMGGEEFVILMAGARAELAYERAESLRAAVKSLHIAGAPEETVTISAGVALYPNHGGDAFAVMRAADNALYESKRNGRDRITLAVVDQCN